MGPYFAIEGSTFDSTVFQTFTEGLRSGLRNLMFASAQTGIEDLSRFSWRSPSCHRVVSSIWPLLAGGVLVGSSWSHGLLLIKGLQRFWRELFKIVRHVPGS